MNVTFPDASLRTITDIRATYRLDWAGITAQGAQTWASDAFHARTSKAPRGPILVIETPDMRQIVACLDFMGEGMGYAGGAWVGAHPTAFTARRDGAAVVLELWDVAACEPGPLHLPMVDGA